MTTLVCNECGKKTKGTLLREQYPAHPDDSPYFLAPLCDNPKCQKQAKIKGAQF